MWVPLFGKVPNFLDLLFYYVLYYVIMNSIFDPFSNFLGISLEIFPKNPQNFIFLVCTTYVDLVGLMTLMSWLILFHQKAYGFPPTKHMI